MQNVCGILIKRFRCIFLYTSYYTSLSIKEEIRVYKEHSYYLKKAVELSRSARKNGNTPFGAVLVDKEGNIIIEQENVEITEKRCTGHAETALVEKASMMYDKDFLWDCTLYSIAEPCAMCSGAIYWANVGRVVYGMTEKQLLELTGSDPQNPTFDLPCREIFERGQKKIEVIGPIHDFDEEIKEVHKNFWTK